jgi:hypothetical protein
MSPAESLEMTMSNSRHSWGGSNLALCRGAIERRVGGSKLGSCYTCCIAVDMWVVGARVAFKTNSATRPLAVAWHVHLEMMELSGSRFQGPCIEGK